MGTGAVSRSGKEAKGSGRRSGQSWIDQEIGAGQFGDVRLEQRLRILLEQLSNGVGESIPLVCQDWANTKAAYRFLSNERVSKAAILAGHFQSTRDRFLAESGPILILHDTTTFSFQREDAAPIGVLKKGLGAKDRHGRPRPYLTCGLLMHSSLAVTTEGLPLGLAAVKFWSRKAFKGTTALKRTINPTRVPIEQKESVRWLENLRQSTALFDQPPRCIHIGDRESDIYELFCTAQEVNTHLLVRTCVDRLAGDGKHTVAEEMQEVRVKGRHRLKVKNNQGDLVEAVLELRYRRIRILPPRGKQKHYPELRLTILYAQERDTPRDREKIDWKLITDLPVRSRAEAIEKLVWYALRWKIEVFHKILKSGCRAEASRLRTAERLMKLLSVFCLLAWRIFWLTMMNRCAADASPGLALTQVEIHLLDQLVKDKPSGVSQPKTLSTYLTKIARLGGYLARAHDPPPGNHVIWKGMSRLTDMELGFMVGVKTCG
jgi:Transposase DNA-binding